MRRVVLLTYILILICSTIIGQNTITIKGTIIDDDTKDALPLANAYIPGTTKGVVSDFDGHFAITIPSATEALSFNVMGYETITIPVKKLSTKEDNIIRMKEQTFAIGEITVELDDFPVQLMKKVITNKKRNDPSQYNRTEFEKYDRWEYAINNISDKAKDNFLIRDAQDLMIVDENDSTRYLPVYMSETISFNETQRSPRRSRSTVIADDVKGIDVFKQYEIGGFTTSMDMELSFYENTIKILGIPFISPISDNATQFYKFYLLDSCMITPSELVGHELSANENNDSIKVYTIKFKPRTEGNRTFEGKMDIETRYLSVRSIDATMPKWTNINFVKKLNMKATYQFVNDSLPFYGTNDIEMHIDYMPVNSDKKRLEIRTHMFNSQRKIRVGMTDTLSLSARGIQYESIKMDDYKKRDSLFWNENRHSVYTEQQKLISQTIDSINNVRSVRAFNNVAKLALTGFLDLGKWELGPYTEVFNSNKVEGIHIGCGVRTSKEISEKWTFLGVVGYGFKSTRITSEASVAYKFPTQKRQAIQATYFDRIAKIGENENILYLYENMLTTSENNIIAQLFKREEIDELYYERKAQLRHDKEWFTGFRSRISLHYLWQVSPKYYPFSQNGSFISNIEQAEASLDLRYSYKEKYIDDGLQRIYMSTDYPIVHFTIACGHVKVGDKTSKYSRIHSTLKHTLCLGPTELNYALEGGAFFGGDLPYSLLEMPRGNKTFGFYRYDFNMMNYLEFVSDKYAYLYVDYFLNGILFNKITAFKKAGLREVVGCKAMLSSLDDRHLKMLDMPDKTHGGNGPYLELNVGIDNVLRFFRFDAVWRVTNKDSGKPPVGIRAQFNFKL
ncbi:MAG: carboxypeptidase-like regulatory domain-containing protein [Marinilabiliaceae bacterium]|nr:carboxypeptidase-like regulatory domain-containing protein [Marinilabiliaceae bacterium]